MGTAQDDRGVTKRVRLGAFISESTSARLLPTRLPRSNL